MLNTKEMAEKYKEQYNAAYNTLSPEHKTRVDKIKNNESVGRSVVEWHDRWIKEICTKVETACEPKLNEIKPK
jgi:hypothetical protein